MTCPSKWFKIYLLPPEHGGWFLLLGPFLFGALAAARPNMDLLTLLLLSLALYISRQPFVILVKALSGRRARGDARPASLALLGMTVVDAALLSALLWRGHTYLLWLGIPAGLVLAWQMFLVTRREERQIGIELVGAGTLALAAPAAYWVSVGEMMLTGWLLWGLAWLYSSSSIVYVYLRLKQRRWTALPPRHELWREGRRTLVYAAFNVVATLLSALTSITPPLTPLPYALATAHYVWGVTHPALGARPARIGIEQAAATLVFYLLLGLVM